MSKQKIVVVGNGMVGHKFIDNIIQADSDQYEVITFSEESRLAYDRVQLTAYFNGKSADDLALTSEAYYQENGVKYLVNAKVTELDTENKAVVTDSGHRESYDKLILATGSFPFVPPIPGNDQEHCHVYRTIEDLDAIELSSKQSKSACSNRRWPARFRSGERSEKPWLRNACGRVRASLNGGSTR